MAKESRHNNKLFIIAIIILTILTIAGIFSIFYFDQKTNKSKKEYDTEYKKKKHDLESIDKEIKDIEKEIEGLSNLSQKKDNLKKEYFKLIKELEDAILAGKSDKKIAYLTFDDGPYYNTYKVFGILEKYDVKATFFTTSINGEYCYDNKKERCLPMYKEYVKRGHTIANHTYTHGIWRGLYNSVDSFMNAVINQENLIKEQTGGYITNIVRFPGGSTTAGKLKDEIIKRLKSRGYGWVDWTAGDGDGGSLQSTGQAWKNLKKDIDENIEVILFHDYSDITTSILPGVIEYLRDNDYILLPLFYESNMINK